MGGGGTTETTWRAGHRSAQNAWFRVWSFTRRLPWFEHCNAQFCYAVLNFDKDHTTLCLHAEFVATHAKPPLSLISRWNKEHDIDF